MSKGQLFLNGARVTTEFRDALFDAANRAGLTPNEFVIVCTAEVLAKRGAIFSGVFSKGDVGLCMPRHGAAA